MGALGEIIDEPVSGPAAAGPVRTQHLAGHPPPAARAGRAAPLHAHLRQRPPAGRAAGHPAQRAGPRGQNRAAEAEGRPPEPGHELVKAHHGSLSRERRLQIEDELKRGELKGLVATSSLELGIDMGAVDLVIQVESPGAVSRGLQRIGRAGHQVGEPSRGKLFPKHRDDLVEAAVVVQRMHDGLIEHTRYPRNPLDVLAQQIVAMCALDEWTVDELAALVRRAAPLRRADRRRAGQRARPAGRALPVRRVRRAAAPHRVGPGQRRSLRGRAGAQRLAVTSGGTIPDRGLFGVFLPDGTRVGELDEEMVYESRPGETFLLGASTWRIEDITHERVVVTPAPGQPGKMPFWHGDGPGRPLELGRALGAFVREIRADPCTGGARAAAARPRPRRAGRRQPAGLPRRAGRGHRRRCPTTAPSWSSGSATRSATGGSACSRRSAPRCTRRGRMALQARLAERWGLDVELMWSDDGIVLRLPEAVDELPIDELLIDPDEIDEIVVSQLPQHGDVRVALPRVRGPGAAAAPPPSRSAHAAVAAAPEGGRPAGGGGQVPRLPDPARGHPRVPQRRVRPAGAA